MHQIRRVNGQCQVKVFDEWEEISEEEFYELLYGGYKVVDDDLLLESSDN